MKPFPSSSVCLAAIKHSFTAQGNPPFHASACPNPLLRRGCCTAEVLSSGAHTQQFTPAHTSESTFPDRACGSPTLPLWVGPPLFYGEHRGLSEKAVEQRGAHVWLLDDKRLFLGRCGCAIFHLPPSSSGSGGSFAQEVHAFTSRQLPLGCNPQCANLFASWLFPRVGAPQTPLDPGRDSEPPFPFAVCPSGSVR